MEEAFNAALAECNQTISKPYRLSASIGSIVTVADESDTLYGMIEQADDKMYEIKKLKKTTRKSERILRVPEQD